MPHRRDSDEVVLDGYLRDLSEQIAEHPRVVVPPLVFVDAWVNLKALHEVMRHTDPDPEAGDRLQHLYKLLARAVQPTGMMKEALRRGFARVNRKDIIRDLQ